MSELSQAINFSIDVQEAMQGGVSLRDAIVVSLPKYPDCEVGQTIKFTDRSEAVLTDNGFIVRGWEPTLTDWGLPTIDRTAVPQIKGS